MKMLENEHKSQFSCPMCSMKLNLVAAKGRFCGKIFTLIELLVVIAIIAILSSLLMPALSNARSIAKTIYCVNNTKQLFLTFMNYADQADGWIPTSDCWYEMICTAGLVKTPIADGVPDFRVCPVNLDVWTNEAIAAGYFDGDPRNAWPWRFSWTGTYSVNWYLDGIQAGGQYGDSIAMYRVAAYRTFKQPSRQMLLGDGGGYPFSQFATCRKDEFFHSSKIGWPHQKRNTVVLFLDGHSLSMAVPKKVDWVTAVEPWSLP